MAAICSSFQLLDKSALPVLYKILVRPHLEYGNIVWGLFNRADQQRVEKVLRRLTKLIPKLHHLPYQQRLQELNSEHPFPVLPTTAGGHDRRLPAAARQTWPNLVPHVFFDTAVARDTRGHPWKLATKPRAIIRIRRNAFSVRVVNDWNSLPPAVVNADTLNQFKNRLDSHWVHVAHKNSSCRWLKWWWWCSDALWNISLMMLDWNGPLRPSGLSKFRTS